MLGSEVRKAFLQFFQEHDHLLFHSSSLLPRTDPSLLFVNAGMNQFKDIFLQRRSPNCLQAVSCQKCLRCGGKHNDIDNVGHTNRHLTFFEMLGNFSFGGYYKEKAIELAWAVSLNVFQMDPKRIFVSVLEGDQETADLWSRWMSQEQIWILGPEDNFWAMGDHGPCGPCSELYYDRGPSFGNENDHESERYVEFWNIVFMQYERNASGQLVPLRVPCIDTGLGLERVCALLQGVSSVFETDLISDLIQHVEKISGKKYKLNKPETHAPFRVIADHIRSISFAIADGINPSNTQRGYVVRKLIRRALQYGKKLGLQEPFLGEIFPILEEKMGIHYPELVQNRTRILEILEQESCFFFDTLRRGSSLMQELLLGREATKEPISGQIAFKLKDTYGVPLEEILLFTEEHNLILDLEEFKQEEEKARNLSRENIEQDKKIDTSTIEKRTPFLGYHSLGISCSIQEIRSENGKEIHQLSLGKKGALLLDRTVFYAKQGGQVCDQGVLEDMTGTFFVEETRYNEEGETLHIGHVTTGQIKRNSLYYAKVDKRRRQDISSHHTATHLLQWALEKHLGTHIHQAGSLVDASRLRFDFNHHKNLSTEEITTIENCLNKLIRQNGLVETEEKKYEEVRGNPSIKQFFNEKYSEVVRVVIIDLGKDGFSKELCGGTHVSQTGELGLFHIVKSQTIASGICRIEAVTGASAALRLQEHSSKIKNLVQIFKTKEELLEEKALGTLQKIKDLEHEIKQFKLCFFQSLVKEWIKESSQIAFSWKILYQELESKWASDSRWLSELVQKEQPFDLVWLYHKKEGSVYSILNTKHARNIFPSAKEILQFFPSSCIGGGSNTLCQFSAPLNDFHDLLQVFLSFVPQPQKK